MRRCTGRRVREARASGLRAPYEEFYLQINLFVAAVQSIGIGRGSNACSYK
jgi:hypothetical protein